MLLSVLSVEVLVSKVVVVVTVDERGGNGWIAEVIDITGHPPPSQVQTMGGWMDDLSYLLVEVFKASNKSTSACDNQAA